MHAQTLHFEHATDTEVTDWASVHLNLTLALPLVVGTSALGPSSSQLLVVIMLRPVGIAAPHPRRGPHPRRCGPASSLWHMFVMLHRIGVALCRCCVVVASWSCCGRVVAPRPCRSTSCSSCCTASLIHRSRVAAPRPHTHHHGPVSSSWHLVFVMLHHIGVASWSWRGPSSLFMRLLLLWYFTPSLLQLRCGSSRLAALSSSSLALITTAA